MKWTLLFFTILAASLAYFTKPYLDYGPPLDAQTFKAKYGPTAGKPNRTNSLSLPFRSIPTFPPVVTGAARGIGAEFAEQLAALGFDLVLVSRRMKTLKPTVDRIKEKHGVKVTAVVAEFGSDDAVSKVIEATKDLEIGLYVNNHAATGLLDPNSKIDASVRRFWVNEPLELHLKQIEVNYVDSVKLMYHFANRMKTNRRGGIIAVGSLSGIAATPFVAQYASTKAGLMQLASIISYELAHFDVDVLSLGVGATDTPALRTATSEKALELIPYQTPAEVVDEALRCLGHFSYRTAGLLNKITFFILGGIAPVEAQNSVQGDFMKENMKWSME